MEETAIERSALSLSQLNGIIKSAISDALPDLFWVIAEIADLKLNQKGHCYLELVEKDEDRTVAQIRGTIWAYEYRTISQKFRKATSEPLRPGMKVLFLASVTFHEVFGLSLNIRDVDPTYTMGDMARKKKEVIDKLRKEGIIDLNKALELPLVPQRIAVISSPTAAGYGDFFNHLDANPYGYRFMHVLFPAVMQGREAEESIISALNDIKGQKERFDVVVVIRGGGSVIELSCLDGYPLASQVARLPLPVITGIGHEKDDTVVDIVSHTKMKTPTAVAEFLISGMRSYEERIITLEDRIKTFAERFLKDEQHLLNSLTQKLTFMPVKLTTDHMNRLLLIRNDLGSHIKQFFQNEKNRFVRIEQALRHLDPANVLKRGYSITSHKGKIVKDASTLKSGMIIGTTLHKGTITSIVQPEKEDTNSGKKQGTDLLPGLE